MPLHFHQHKLDFLTDGGFLSLPFLWINRDCQPRNKRYFVLVLRAQSLITQKEEHKQSTFLLFESNPLAEV